MNKTLKFLMLSDIFIISGFGLMAPILAIFIKENITNGTIFAAGFASSLFLITKCLIQLPFSKYVDEHDDKIKWLISGTFFIALVPFGYLLATNIVHIYIVQTIYGIGSGLAYPTWLGLWSTNLDKKKESYEWSLYSTVTSLGTAIAAALGAAIANSIGFGYTFAMVGVMSLVGWLILFSLQIKNEKPTKIKITNYQRKRKIVGN